MTTREQVDQLSPAKRAVYEIRQLRGRVEELERLRNEPVAIIGMGLRFPGNAANPEQFWNLLASGANTVTEIPASRWPLEAYYDPDPSAPGKTDVRYASLIGDSALFDPGFFGISPREAISMDPQQRLALEVGWEALENAGYNPLGLEKSDAGVFLALSNSDYNRLAFEDQNGIDTYTATGNVFSVAAGRISFLLGLTGPSVAVDTACSGSLVAVHLACQSLRTSDCRMALAGGVNLILTPEITINLAKARMLARDGRCKAFDARADGFVRAEGCGVVVLKRLSDALADRDRILAVIRGSAVNQDGRSSGLTVPNLSAQESLIRQALRNARTEPESVSYVEAHGTGTSLGDPIEARALAAVLGPGRTAANPLMLGSVKANIGHLEAAAGVAGLIKAVLALHKEAIPPQLHFQQLNPHIDWGGMPVEIPTALKPWPRGEKKRVAGVSAFGFSGTNAHVILEEAPPQESAPRAVERPLQLLALSAKTPQAFEDLRQNYRSTLSTTNPPIGDFCHTANAGRAHFQERAAYVGSELKGLLDAPVARGTAEMPPEIVFLFSGQGAQYAGMGKELYQTQPIFRAALDECSAGLAGQIEDPLLEILWGAASAKLDQTASTQPALFALEYALARLWQSWGIQPAAVLGHSVGEYVAACIAGVYSLADGLQLISARGRLMQAVSGQGGMLAVRSSEAQARAALAGLETKVSLAAVNGPSSVVVAGYQDGLTIVEQRLKDAGIVVQRLHVSHGFHSPQMAGMEDAFEKIAARIRCSRPQIELISSWTAQPVRGGEMSQPAYWRNQVSHPVRFAAAMEALRGYRVFLEIGPGTTLTRLGQQNLHDTQHMWVNSFRQNRGEWEQMLESLGQLYVAGAEVDWQGFDAPYARRKVSLPTYPFQRERYWIETTPHTNSTPQLIGDTSKAWQSACDAAAHQSECGPFDLDVAAYPALWDALDQLSDAYIRNTLAALGAFQSAGERHTAQSLAQQSGIDPRYERLIGRWLRRLADSGALRRDGDRFAAAEPLASPDLAALCERAIALHGRDRVFLDYVLRCGDQLVPILTGRLSALATIFPEGDFALAEDLYERAPVAAYFRHLCRSALEGYLRGRRAGSCRLLEIGAGTGATASALLPVLPPETSEYHFTDVSEMFLNRARQKFAAYPFVRYGRLDMESDPASQGYPAGDFDIVAATNVLHAARDLRATIRRVKSLLAPGGILILCEATTHLRWFDITTGLIEGWQVFDDGLRGDHPLLSGEQWQTALLDGGFEAAAVYPPARSRAQALAQRVIVARAPDGSAASARTPVTPTHRTAADLVAPAPALISLLEAPPLQRHDGVVALMRQELAQMLRFSSPDQVDRRRRLTDLGIDSLMALEFSGRITKALHLEKPLSSTLVFDYPTLDALAGYLLRDILHFEAAEAAPAEAGPAGDSRLDELDRLSDEEIEALLLQKVKAL